MASTFDVRGVPGR